MRKDRYELCKKLIEEGQWQIDLENGIVTGRKFLVNTTFSTITSIQGKIILHCAIIPQDSPLTIVI